MARSLVRPLRTLRDSALRVAHDDLAREIDRVRAGKEPGPVEPIPVHTTEEIGQVAHAVDELHEQAVLLAGEQSRLQLQVSDMFETLSRRSRSLVDQQLVAHRPAGAQRGGPRAAGQPVPARPPGRPDAPQRRQPAGARRREAAARAGRPGAAVAALINAAASEVEDYTPRRHRDGARQRRSSASVAGDLVHLLAELIDNALRYSPPISQVRVSAVHTGNGGLVIEVSDVGLGMTDADLRVANTRLQSGGEVTPYTARHMGLFVVGRLADQHGSGRPAAQHHCGEKPNSGTTAGVYLPLGAASACRHARPADTGAHGTPTDAHRGIATALALASRHDDAYSDFAMPTTPTTATRSASISSTVTPSSPVTLLPQRNPGASGITGPQPRRSRAVAGRDDDHATSRRRSRAEPDEHEPASQNSRGRLPSTPRVLRRGGVVAEPTEPTESPARP